MLRFRYNATLMTPRRLNSPIRSNSMPQTAMLRMVLKKYVDRDDLREKQILRDDVEKNTLCEDIKRFLFNTSIEQEEAKNRIQSLRKKLEALVRVTSSKYIDTKIEIELWKSYYRHLTQARNELFYSIQSLFAQYGYSDILYMHVFTRIYVLKTPISELLDKYQCSEEDFVKVSNNIENILIRYITITKSYVRDYREQYSKELYYVLNNTKRQRIVKTWKQYWDEVEERSKLIAYGSALNATLEKKRYKQAITQHTTINGKQLSPKQVWIMKKQYKVYKKKGKTKKVST